jgi:ankyrin repeat protein
MAGGTELHDLCCAEPLHADAHFEAVLKRLQEHPEEAKKDDDDGNLALHLLLKADPPLPLVKALVEAYPEAPFEENKHGYLPLHVACRYGNSVEVVEFLIEKNPQAKQRPTQGYFSWNLVEMAHYLMSGGQGMTCQDLIKKLPEDHPHRGPLLKLWSE